MALAEGLRIAVIIPAYRAEETIEKVVHGIPSWVDAIYVVDDASPDQTTARVRACADSRLQLLVHEVNRGVGGAMVTGYQHSLLQGIDICVKMDADDQMDPTYLSELVHPLVIGRADFTKGNRFHHKEALRQMPLVRLIGNAALSFMIKTASGQWHLFDPTNGFTAIHRTALISLNLQDVHPGYFFESSMLILLGKIGGVIEDVPIPARYSGERSSLGIGRTLVEFPWLFLRYGFNRILWRYFIADFTAVSLCLVCGIPLLVFGILFGLYHWVENYSRNIATPTGTVMLAVLPLILGFQLILQALVLDVQNGPQQPLQMRVRRPPP